MKILASLSSPWRYWCAMDHKSDIVEMSRGQGRILPALAMHIDEEDQIVFVRKGDRSFFFPDGREIHLTAGQATMIRAGVPHASSSSRLEAENVCINLYVRQGRITVSSDFADILRAELGNFGVKIVPSYEGSFQPLSDHTGRLLLRHSIQDLASLNQMSREGYSRKFKQLYGVSPCALKSLLQVGKARSLLRIQRDIAQVAAEAGFYDQSHLGRHFKPVMGTTPKKFALEV